MIVKTPKAEFHFNPKDKASPVIITVMGEDASILKSGECVIEIPLDAIEKFMVTVLTERQKQKLEKGLYDLTLKEV